MGVAIGQTFTNTATPLETLQSVDGNPNWPAISHLIAEWQPAALVVGMPIAADRSETSIVMAVRKFIRELTERYQLPVHIVDEHLSSWEAESRLVAVEDPVPTGRHRGTRGKGSSGRFPKEAIDRVAAQIILQTWLSEQKIHDE